MSSNPFNLDRALDTLRSEHPAEGATLRAKNALLKPTPRSFRPRLLVMAAVGAGVAVLLWPRPGTGSAWAQVASKTGSQVRVHMAMYAPGQSKPYSQRWIDGARYRMEFHLTGISPGTVGGSLISVSDGSRYFRYMSGPRQKNGDARSGHVGSAKPNFMYGTGGIMGATSNFIDEVIKQESWTVLERKEDVSTAKGVRDVYRLYHELPHGAPWRFVAYVDPKTKLVMEVEALDEKGKLKSTSLFDYPPSMPDTVFELKPPAGIRMRDMDKENEMLAASMKRGLGTATMGGRKITLRALLHDASGKLWVLWTGGAPAGDMKYPVLVKGFPKRPGAGIKAFTVEGDGRAKAAPSVGERLGGMAITLPAFTRLDKATVTVPVLDKTGKKKLGVVTFTDAPVFRIDMIYEFAETLGMR